MRHYVEDMDPGFKGSDDAKIRRQWRAWSRFHGVRTITALLILFFSMPAHAQSFYPNLAGARYCQLRRLGIERGEALRTAMTENWDPNRKSLTVTRDGQELTLDQIDLAQWVVRCR
jgi:hypothetical protein